MFYKNFCTFPNFAAHFIKVLTYISALFPIEVYFLQVCLFFLPSPRFWKAYENSIVNFLSTEYSVFFFFSRPPVLASSWKLISTELHTYVYLSTYIWIFSMNGKWVFSFTSLSHLLKRNFWIIILLWFIRVCTRIERMFPFIKNLYFFPIFLRFAYH